jgi:murein DD-endopeptidase MepM/ murein hydrolase activator NlpD
MRKVKPGKRALAEILESRVLLSGPPNKFVIPIGGVPQIDWAIQAYMDHNPAVGAAFDYRGRGYAFDGSNSTHFGLADMAAMDRGVDVYAAAPGTVIEAHDGEFDRHLVILNPPPQDNYVLIDHGDGWRTRYGHMRNGSVTVTPGQVVTAGQKLGLVGGSGNFAANYFESDAFLDFDVMYNGEHVETFLDPQACWQSPPPFAGDVPTVFYMTTSSQNVTNTEADGFQADEHILRRRVFHRGEQVFTFTRWHGLNAGVLRQYRYFRPDGSWFTDTANAPIFDRAVVFRSGALTLSSTAPLGTWQVAAEFNGVELGRTSFIVADPSEGLPEMKVFQESTYVIDGRTTPIDFGSIGQGSGLSGRSFRLSNFGTRPLVVSAISLPAGFTLEGGLPTVPADGFEDIFVRLDDVAAGSKGGWVTIHSNDTDNAAFKFAVKGVVVGVPPAVTAAEFVPQSAPHRLRFAFDQDVGESLSAADLTVMTDGPGSPPVALSEPTWDPATKTATFAISSGGILPDGNYRATLSGAGVLNGSTPMAGDYNLNFFVLAGDATRDRWVDFGDLVILAQNYGQANKTFADGDFNYDGTVGFEDLVILAQRYNTTLPAPVGAGATITLSESEVLSAQRNSKERLFNTSVPIRKPAAASERRRPARPGQRH